MSITSVRWAADDATVPAARRSIPRRSEKCDSFLQPRRRLPHSPPLSLSQPGRPRESLAGHRRVADAIAAGDPDAAAQAMHEHVMLVSDVALLRDRP